MAKVVTVCKFDEFAPNTMRRVKVGKKAIVVIRQQDELYALEDRCSHEDYPLSDGFLDDGVISCSLHGARFDLKTGDALSMPAYEGVATFKVQNNSGTVELLIE